MEFDSSIDCGMVPVISQAGEPLADEAALLAIATRLAQEGARGRCSSLAPLGGGRNNRVYRVETECGEPLVLKSYFRDARDPRDRRAAEWAFLTYARSRGITGIPEPLATEADAGVSLLGFVGGRRIAAGEVMRAHVMAALKLVLDLNPPNVAGQVPSPRALAAVPAASEACFSISEHVSTVARRVARLDAIDVGAPLRDEAVAFVAETLRPAWQRVSSRIAEAVSVDPAGYPDPVDERDLIYSPSDFGFHNALVDDDGRVTFLDFEYAGRDDPAKLLCDFFCQPEVPIPSEYFTEFRDRMAGGLLLSDAFGARASLLLDAYRIKWACIKLNDFLPIGDARRSFAEPMTRAERCAAQLAKAGAALAAIN